MASNILKGFTKEGTIEELFDLLPYYREEVIACIDYVSKVSPYPAFDLCGVAFRLGKYQDLPDSAVEFVLDEAQNTLDINKEGMFNKINLRDFITYEADLDWDNLELKVDYKIKDGKELWVLLGLSREGAEANSLLDTEALLFRLASETINETIYWNRIRCKKIIMNLDLESIREKLTSKGIFKKHYGLEKEGRNGICLMLSFGIVEDNIVVKANIEYIPLDSFGDLNNGVILSSSEFEALTNAQLWELIREEL